MCHFPVSGLKYIIIGVTAGYINSTQLTFSVFLSTAVKWLQMMLLVRSSLQDASDCTSGQGAHRGEPHVLSSGEADGGCGSVRGCWFDSPGLRVKVSSGKTLNPRTAPGVLACIWHGSNRHRCLNSVEISVCLTSTLLFLHNLPFPTPLF